MARKFALMIGNSEYDDVNLAQLLSPSVDVDRLVEILRSPEIGEFDEVVELTNKPFADLFTGIADFFAEKKADDLLLLYFSGHGILDESGKLYLAAKNTRYNRVSGTAISSTFISEEMQRSLSKRQVLILDCCHSGAFSRGNKGEIGKKAITNSTFELGYGKIVIAATDSTQYAWEGENIIGEAENSLFTQALIQGLRTGEADLDSDGKVSVRELYDFIYERIASSTTKQTPTLFSQREQGNIFLAKNPDPEKSILLKLPDELRIAISSSLPKLREAAVYELDALLHSNDAELVQAAESALRKLSKDGLPLISSGAGKILESRGGVLNSNQKKKSKRLISTLAENIVLEISPNTSLYFTLIPETIKSNTQDSTKGKIIVSDFYICNNLIDTNAFSGFLYSKKILTNLNAPKERIPQTKISWYVAMEFCEWLSTQTKRIFRLPTEAEWLKALEFNNTVIIEENTIEKDKNHTLLYSKLGEWCLDWYRDNQNNDLLISKPIVNPTGPQKGTRRVVRKSSKLGANEYDSRLGLFPSFWYPDIGFRVVVQA